MFREIRGIEEDGRMESVWIFSGCRPGEKRRCGLLLSTAASAELCQSFNAVHELQDLFFHSSQYTMPFKILHYKSFFLSGCAVKTCFRAIGIRQNFIFSDILCESQRRAYDKSCNM